MEAQLSSGAKARSHNQFISSHYSPAIFLLVVVGNVAFNFAVFSNSEVFISLPFRSYSKFILLALSLGMRLVAFVQLWLIWFLKSGTDAQLQDASAMDDKQKKAMENLQFMQSMYPILMSASLSIHILLELFDNTCSGSAVAADTLNISLIGLKVYPLVTFFLLRDTDLRAILCAWGYGLFIMLVCAIKFQSSDQLGEVVAFSFASTLVFYDSYRQQKAMMQIVKSCSRRWS